MGDIICVDAHRTTEFQVLTDPATGTTERRFGTCGETMDSALLTAALGTPVSVQQTYSWMRSHAGVDASGASTMGENIDCCKAFGATLVDQLGFSSTLAWTDVLAFLRKHAGANPVGFETSKGQALVDSITGLGENATNLQYHFPAVLGYHIGGVSDYPVANGRALPEGVWVADGCNFAYGNSRANNYNAGDALEFYPMSVMQAAALVGLFALKGRQPLLTLSQVASRFTLNADGSWHAITTGKNLAHGMLQFYQAFQGGGSLAGFSDVGLPLTNEIPIGTKDAQGHQPTIQVFERGAYIYDPDRVVDNPPGSVGSIYKSHLNRPEVLAALNAVSPPPPPTPPASATFGTPIASQEVGMLTIEIPFVLKP